MATSANNIHSETIKAGKRTYFIDIKKTANGQMFLTLTESKRTFSDSGEPQHFRSTLVLYREDVNKFLRGLNTGVNKLKELMPDFDFAKFDTAEGGAKPEAPIDEDYLV